MYSTLHVVCTFFHNLYSFSSLATQGPRRSLGFFEGVRSARERWEDECFERAEVKGRWDREGIWRPVKSVGGEAEESGNTLERDVQHEVSGPCRYSAAFPSAEADRREFSGF